ADPPARFAVPLARVPLRRGGPRPRNRPFCRRLGLSSGSYTRSGAARAALRAVPVQGPANGPKAVDGADSLRQAPTAAPARSRPRADAPMRVVRAAMRQEEQSHVRLHPPAACPGVARDRPDPRVPRELDPGMA